MKILHIIPSISIKSGGPAATMGNIVDVWKLSSIESDVLTIRDDELCYEINCDITQCGASFPARLSNSSQACRWFRENYGRYDLIFFHCIWSLINLRLAASARRLGVPYVVVPHGSLDPFDLRKKAWLKGLLGPLLVRPYLRGARALLFSTQREAADAVSYGAGNERRAIFWPVQPTAALVDRAAVRRLHGIEEGEFVFVFLGRIDYKKGFPILLPAMKRLLDAGRQVRLLIVGPDSRGYSKEVARLTALLAIGPNVQVLPPAVGRAKSELLQAADSFVLPSLNENYAIAVVEAMQHGLPVVISNNVYIHGLIADARAGIVCGYDTGKLAVAMAQMMDEHSARRAMAAAAVRLGMTLTPSGLKDQYTKLLSELTSQINIK